MLTNMNSMDILFMESGIETKEFGFIKSFKIKDFVGSDFTSEDYEKFMYCMRIVPEIYGFEKDFKSLLLFFVEIDGKGLKFSDGFRFLKEFNIKEYFIKGLNILFDKVEVFNSDGVIVLNEKYVLHQENFEKFRNIILKMNNSEKFELTKKKEKKYNNPSMAGRFEVYQKHKLMAMRRNIPTYDFMVIFLLSKIGFDKKKEVMNMNLYDFLLAFDCFQAEESYEKVYSQYLAGANPKELDLTHWGQKIKKKWSDNIG